MPASGKQGKVVAIDLSAMEAIAGAEILTVRFLADDAPQRLIGALGGGADVVLSDMAPQRPAMPRRSSADRRAGEARMISPARSCAPGRRVS